MGLCGWAVARMLRVPLLMTYHTDFPAYALSFTKDYRVGNAVADAMRWFYGQSTATFTRSTAYRTDLLDMGLSEQRLCSISPGVNTTTFAPTRSDPGIWQRLGIKEPRRIMYCGRVSEEKNLALLAEAFQRLCRIRNDTALVIAGDGPYLETFKRTMKGFPAYFLGRQNDATLGPLYAGADLFAFPSRTDTLGQVVMEAQCSGCPTLVTNEGGPRELIIDGVTGHVLPATNVDRWVEAMADLLADEPKRTAMSQAAKDRAHQFSIKASFAMFWDRHAQAAEGPVSELELAHSYPRFFARVQDQ
jgi:glycosyltransferase involved in cell wall biosynthesis